MLVLVYASQITAKSTGEHIDTLDGNHFDEMFSKQSGIRTNFEDELKDHIIQDHIITEPKVDYIMQESH